MGEPTDSPGLWDLIGPRLERLAPEAARAHGVVPLLVQRLRTRDLEIPAVFLQEERAARMANALAPSVLARAREAYDGRMMLLKGPEVSSLYPGRARMLVDLDLLVDDAPAAREALLASGFVSSQRAEPVSEPFYHVDPVELPGVPLPIELHKSFRWPNGLAAPPNDELFDEAVPASVGIAGLLAPRRADHAVLLAGHAWAERPLQRLRDLIDVAAMGARQSPEELEQIARRWGWERIWGTTSNVVRWLLGEGPKPSAVRVWARHLVELREPSAVDRELARWLPPFWALPTLRALYIDLFFAKRALFPDPSQ